MNVENVVEYLHERNGIPRLEINGKPSLERRYFRMFAEDKVFYILGSWVENSGHRPRKAIEFVAFEKLEIEELVRKALGNDYKSAIADADGKHMIVKRVKDYGMLSYESNKASVNLYLTFKKGVPRLKIVCDYDDLM